MSTASSDLRFSAGGRSRALSIRRMPQAKRMRLSVDPRDGGIRLILPRRMALPKALAWVEGQRDWIETALATLPQPRPIRAGTIIPFEGEELLIDWAPDRPRQPCRADDRLIVGGPAESLSARIVRWLRGEAAETLAEETRAMAARAGVAVGRVTIGDPRARWGSCSAAGDIRYSWRLILAPVPVREATVAHEVAHRLHMHHGPAFHDCVRELLGRDPAPERAWLREKGAALYWLGRDS